MKKTILQKYKLSIHRTNKYYYISIVDINSDQHSTLFTFNTLKDKISSNFAILQKKVDEIEKYTKENNIPKMIFYRERYRFLGNIKKFYFCLKEKQIVF